MVTTDNKTKAEGVPLVKTSQNPTLVPRPNRIAMSPRGAHEANIGSTSEGEREAMGMASLAFFQKKGVYAGAWYPPERSC